MNDQQIEQEIQAKGLTAPRVTLADLDANIASVEIHKHQTEGGQVMRWAIITTRSGFAVVGKPSVAVSHANDNAEIGEKVAIDNSRNELWPLMGYQLKQQLHEQQQALARFDVAANLPPHQARVLVEAAELADKIEKLQAFGKTALYAGLSADERARLINQLGAMELYHGVLLERIEAFKESAQ